ncbi:interleukin-8-like [Pygocentrus nattereri]|uniref:interleukin-8-like n=1 Tax=Pygocentrus nattereri TaxID=42514 RepID=UPI000814568D|nr:interleukin-8-like [Pygocentrus nattereri]XP_037391395.1 interleukin-8-like [Pygocentrus nattereri]
MSATTLSIAFLTCVLLSMTEGRIIIKQPKCLCPSTYSKEIQLNRIQKFVIIAPGPHCRNLEVIFTVKNQKKVVDVCVNPSDQWVQDVMKMIGQSKDGK